VREREEREFGPAPTPAPVPAPTPAPAPPSAPAPAPTLDLSAIIKHMTTRMDAYRRAQLAVVKQIHLAAHVHGPR